MPVRGGAGGAVEDLPPLLHLRPQGRQASRSREDLRGKRVGTSQYSSTGLCFMRGMLEHDYGIKSEDMHWFMGGLNTFVEQPLIPLNLPKAIKLDFLSGTQTLEKMFDAGELDALLTLYIPQSFLDGAPHIARLWPNFKEVETGLLPAHKDLSDHAHGGGARGRAPRASLGGQEHLQGVLRGEGDGRRRSLRHRCAASGACRF